MYVTDEGALVEREKQGFGMLETKNEILETEKLRLLKAVPGGGNLNEIRNSRVLPRLFEEFGTGTSSTHSEQGSGPIASTPDFLKNSK
jgi:hypothetical protein